MPFVAEVSPDCVIGTPNAQGSVIDLGECSEKQRLYYIAMLKAAANNGYDYTLIRSGSDVVLSRRGK